LSRWWITEATPHGSVQDQIGRAASLQARQEARATTRVEAIVERGSVIIGAPDLNVGHLMLLWQCGSLGKELAKDNTKRFSEKVMPRVRGFFSAWKDTGWPAPMAPSERAAPMPFHAPASAAA
jgi:hypothetical protein